MDDSLALALMTQGRARPHGDGLVKRGDPPL